MGVLYRLGIMVSLVAFLLLGFMLLQPHDGVSAGTHAEISKLDDGHCAGDPSSSDQEHCYIGIHSHTCCIMIEAARMTAETSTRRWLQPRSPILLGLAPYPFTRPPIHFVI